jgi:hypothetical protein
VLQTPLTTQRGAVLELEQSCWSIWAQVQSEVGEQITHGIIVMWLPWANQVFLQTHDQISVCHSLAQTSRQVQTANPASVNGRLQNKITKMWRLTASTWYETLQHREMHLLAALTAWYTSEKFSNFFVKLKVITKLWLSPRSTKLCRSSWITSTFGLMWSGSDKIHEGWRAELCKSSYK